MNHLCYFGNGCNCKERHSLSFLCRFVDIVVRHHRADAGRLGEDQEEDGEGDEGGKGGNNGNNEGQRRQRTRPTDKFRILLLSDGDGETLGKKDIMAILHPGKSFMRVEKILFVTKRQLETLLER
jgi:hypothetical protein